MTDQVRFDAEGAAALGICKSLLIALTETRVIGEEEARDLLTDVITTHQEAAAGSAAPYKHHAVVAIIERILAAKNGVREAIKS